MKQAFGNPLMNDRPRSRAFEEAALDEGNQLFLITVVNKISTFEAEKL